MRKIIALGLMLVLLFPLCVTAQEIDYSTVNSEVAPIDFPDGYTPYFNDYTVTLLAKMLYGEGGATMEQKAGACYTVFWHYEDGAGAIKHILESWYYGYSARHPVTWENYEIAKDVYIRYDMWKCGYSVEECGIVLPPGYKYFDGDGKNNTFRNHWKRGLAEYWRWTLPSPYGG